MTGRTSVKCRLSNPYKIVFTLNCNQNSLFSVGELKFKKMKKIIFLLAFLVLYSCNDFPKSTINNEISSHYFSLCRNIAVRCPTNYTSGKCAYKWATNNGTVTSFLNIDSDIRTVCSTCYNKEDSSIIAFASEKKDTYGSPLSSELCEVIPNVATTKNPNILILRTGQFILGLDTICTIEYTSQANNKTIYNLHYYGVVDSQKVEFYFEKYLHNNDSAIYQIHKAAENYLNKMIIN